MSESNQQPPPKQSKSKSSTKVPVVSFLISILVKLLSVSLVAGALCLFIEFCLYFVVDDALTKSLHRYETMATFDNTGKWIDGDGISNYAENTFMTVLRIPLIVGKTKEFSHGLASKLQHKANDQTIAGKTYLYLTKFFLSIPDLMSLWVIVTFTWFAKVLSILSMIIPCLIIVGVGLVDGSVERKINTYKGTRDSQDKIEWWFIAFKSSSYTVIFLYVALPNSLEAGLVMLPSALLTAFFIRNVVSNYKKYF